MCGKVLLHLAVVQRTARATLTGCAVAATQQLALNTVGADADRTGGDGGRRRERAHVHERPQRQQRSVRPSPRTGSCARVLAATTYGGSGLGGGAAAGGAAAAATGGRGRCRRGRRRGTVAVGVVVGDAPAGSEPDASDPASVPPPRPSAARRSRERLSRCSGISVTAVLATGFAGVTPHGGFGQFSVGHTIGGETSAPRNSACREPDRGVDGITSELVATGRGIRHCGTERRPH